MNETFSHLIQPTFALAMYSYDNVNLPYLLSMAQEKYKICLLPSQSSDFQHWNVLEHWICNFKVNWQPQWIKTYKIQDGTVYIDIHTIF